MDLKVLFQKLLRNGQRPGYIRHNGICLTSVEEGVVRGEMLITENSHNPLGIAHGGALAGLADTLAGYVVATTGRRAVTNDCLMTYLHPVTGGKVYCTARMRKAGGKICVVTASLTDDQGTEVAMGTFNFAVLGRETGGDRRPAGGDEPGK